MNNEPKKHISEITKLLDAKIITRLNEITEFLTEIKARDYTLDFGDSGKFVWFPKNKKIYPEDYEKEKILN